MNFGEMVTTESKYQDYVIALGRQDKFSNREPYNPVIRSADMIVAPSHYHLFCAG